MGLNIYRNSRRSFLLVLALVAMCGSLAPGCHRPSEALRLKEGDLLFQDLDCGPMCDAIEAVTQGVNGRNFSHCALVVRIDDTLRVVEAVGAGVRIHSIRTFLARSGDTSAPIHTVLGRLKPHYQNLIPGAVAFALEQVGAPYDRAFLPNNGSWYCSELIYEAFKQANQNQPLFPLEPMTFKASHTDDFFPVWISYYNELGQEIPEGIPGINPGSLSRSDKLDILPWFFPEE